MAAWLYMRWETSEGILFLVGLDRRWDLVAVSILDIFPVGGEDVSDFSFLIAAQDGVHEVRPGDCDLNLLKSVPPPAAVCQNYIKDGRHSLSSHSSSLSSSGPSTSSLQVEMKTKITSIHFRRHKSGFHS